MLLKIDIYKGMRNSARGAGSGKTNLAISFDRRNNVRVQRIIPKKKITFFRGDKTEEKMPTA